MVIVNGPHSLALAKGAMVCLPDVDGFQLHCREGSLWVTLDYDSRDIVLEAGARYTGSGHRRALVYALEKSCVTLRPAGASRPATAPEKQRAGWFAPAHA